MRRERYKRYTSFFGARFLLFGAKTKANQELAKGREIWRAQIWDACRKDLEASQNEEKERKMEYESDGEIKERAYRMHEMGGANWRIAQILGESESTIERWIYEGNWNRGREEGMQLLAQVALMLLDEQRYEDLKKLGNEQFRNQAIEEYEEKKKTGRNRRI